MGRWGGRDRSDTRVNALDGFNEADHPRDADGKFGSGGGGGGSYGAQLKKNTYNNSEFDGLIKKLREDKSVSLEQLRKIAEEFHGHEPKKNMSRKELIERMVRMQMVHARTMNRAKNMDLTSSKNK